MAATDPRAGAAPPGAGTPGAGTPGGGTPGAELIETRVLMDGAAIARALGRIAGEIVERAGGTADLCLVAIRTGGVPIAERLRALVAEAEGVPADRIPVGSVDIALYRDDVLDGRFAPVVGPTEIPFPVRDRVVVLVDDVLYTGRTVRAAIDALIEFGRPRRIELAVLVDRGWRELPIQPDYLGLRADTRREETVKVRLAPGEERAVVCARRGAP